MNYTFNKINLKKNKTKKGQRSEQTPRYTDGKQAYEKMLIIFCQKGTAN